MPAIVAAPAAEAVFTSVGATNCFFGIVVVDVVLVVVETLEPDARAPVVVVVEAELTGAAANVNSTFVDWLAYVSSAARVMVTMHFPAVLAFNTPLVMKHPAPPGADKLYETAPVPDPPPKLSVIPLPAVPDVGEVREPCVGTAFENVKVNVADSDE